MRICLNWIITGITLSSHKRRPEKRVRTPDAKTEQVGVNGDDIDVD